MSDSRICPFCQTPVPADAPMGLCPSCLIGAPIGGAGSVGAISPLAKGPRRIGDYEVLDEGREGGMGIVYRARQRSLNRIVALKMIHLSRRPSPSDLERFQIEAEACAALRHENIVEVFEANEHNGQPYFSMAYLEGGDLRAELRKLQGQPMPAERAARLMSAVARAVHHAHQRGILHRDLKPGNILFDKAGKPYVTDFGLAKFVHEPAGPADATTLLDSGPIQEPAAPGVPSNGQDAGQRDSYSDVQEASTAEFDDRMPARNQGDAVSELTRPGQGMGSPGYTSPEQAAGKTTEVSTASDVFSLGVIFYRLVTGQAPFPTDDWVEFTERVCAGQFLRPSILNPQVDADLEAICLRCLEPNPGRRANSAEGLADQLDHWLKHEPLDPSWRDTPSWERGGKWVRRHRAATALIAALVLCAMLVGLGVSSWRRAETNWAQGKIQDAETGFEQNATHQALGLLEEVLRRQPANRVAAVRLLTALTQRTFALCNGELSHGDETLCANFSPDGSRIVTASRDHTAKLWDARTGQLLVTFSGHADEVFWATFSPDGRRVATASRDRSARLWDLSGRLLAEFTNHPAAVRLALFSPDGRQLLTIATNLLQTWDLATQRPLLRFPVGTNTTVGTNTIVTAQFHPDGSRFATASQDGTVRMWDLRTGDPAGTPLQHAEAVVAIHFSPDGNQLVTAAREINAAIWHLESAGVSWLPHNNIVGSAQFSPDGQVVATAAGNTIHFWNALTGEPGSTVLRHAQNVTSLAFSTNGAMLLSTSEDGTARLWDWKTGQALAEPIRYADSFEAAQFSPDGRQFVTVPSDSKNSQPRLWQTPVRQPLVKPLPLPQGVERAEFTPDGRAAVFFTNNAMFWCSNDLAQVQLEQRPFDGPIDFVRFRADGRRFLVVSGRQVQVFDFPPTAPARPVVPNSRAVHRAVFSPDGQWLALASETSVQIYDAATGHSTQWSFPHDDFVEMVEFSPDGNRLATASHDGIARVWHIRSGRLLAFPKTESLLSARFSPDGRRVVTAADKQVGVFNAATGQQLLPWLDHTAHVYAASFSPEGQRLVTVTAAPDRTLRIWCAATGQPMSDPLPLDANTDDVRFTSCGRWVVTSSGVMWETPWFDRGLPWRLPQLANAVSEQGNPIQTLKELRNMMAQSAATDFPHACVQWFLADPRTRPISPSAQLTVPAYVKRQRVAGLPGGNVPTNPR